MNVILSIKPIYVEEIFSGNKQFEYRKVIFKRKIDKVYVYASSPVCRIVGEFSVAEIFIDSPLSIWNKTKYFSGITEEKFFDYFKHHHSAYALKISNLQKYKESINPYEEIRDFTAPQSFRYIDYSLKTIPCNE